MAVLKTIVQAANLLKYRPTSLNITEFACLMLAPTLALPVLTERP
jgi:hypothetical protein